MSLSVPSTNDCCSCHVQDGGEDISSVLKAIDEPLIPGLIGADADDPKASVHDVHQLNRESE